MPRCHPTTLLLLLTSGPPLHVLPPRGQLSGPLTAWPMLMLEGVLTLRSILLSLMNCMCASALESYLCEGKNLEESLECLYL